MATKAERRAVAALRRKKERRARKVFVVEGRKSVEELLSSDWPVERLYATEEWEIPPECGAEVVRVDPGEMEEMSTLESPQPVLAVAKMREEPDVDPGRGRWLMLDGIRDPGNLGTLVRLADWFGLDGLLLSPDCVDWSNPKVVQAGMGSLFRVPFLVRDPLELFDTTPPVWCAGAFLRGENVYECPLPADGWLVLGNEAHGIRPEVEARIPRRLTIPRFGGAESLNAAMAAAVFCSEWRGHAPGPASA